MPDDRDAVIFRDELPSAPRTAQQARFGAFQFDARINVLYRQKTDGAWVPVTLGSRALAVLHVLLRDPGALVSKDALLDAVWPDVTVENNNLTVQVATLRKVLDQGRGGDSYIQTVPGRGYRFTSEVTSVIDATSLAPAEPAPLAPSPQVPAQSPVRWRQVTRWRLVIAASGGVLLALLAVAGHANWHKPVAKPLSLAILPFSDTSNPADPALATGFTDDLATNLSILDGARVAARDLTIRYVSEGMLAIDIGRALGVRYVLTGSMRRTGETARVNAELISTQTGGVLWTDGFDFKIDGAGLSAAEYRLRHLVPHMIDNEVARARRERPDTPNAVDLVLQTRQLLSGPPNPLQQKFARNLMERALKLDPRSESIKTRLVSVLLDDLDLNHGGRKDVLERTRSLLAATPRGQQFSANYQIAHLFWLAEQDDRCRETVEAANIYGEAYPRLAAPLRWLGYCQTQLGHADQAVTQLQQAIAMEPLNGYRASNYRNLAYALLMLGRCDESIVWARRALAANPDFDQVTQSRLLRIIAAAAGLLGHTEEARQALSRADGVWPYATLRWVAAYQPWSPAHDIGLTRMQEGLRLAGLRDHAEETADFGTSPSIGLVQIVSGHTPVSAPGVTTIITTDLVRLLAVQHPIVIDTVLMEQGWSLPGAIGLRYVGEGGDLSDDAQARLAVRMQVLSHGDRSRPIVAVGWNAERYDGRNLALRLAALGYTSVYWYRGGREAWAVNNLPQAPLVEQEW